MNIPQLLQSCGLTESEAKVYLAALKKPQMGPSEVAALSKIKRTTVYHALETLAQKGFVTTVGNRRALRYRALAPEQLPNLLHRKEVELAALKKKIERALPLFSREDDEAPAGMPQIEFFRGFEGIKNAAEQIFQAKRKEILSLSPSFDIMGRTVSDDYSAHFIQEFRKRGFTIKNIWQDLPKNAEVFLEKSAVREARLASKETCGEFGAGFFIFDNTVIIVTFLPELYAVLIRSFSYAETMRALWQTIWNISKPLVIDGKIHS